MILNSISVDCVIFGFDKSGLRVLLNQIDKEALQNALPKQASSDQIKQIYEKHPVLTSDNYWSLFGEHVAAEVLHDGEASVKVAMVDDGGAVTFFAEGLIDGDDGFD